MRIRVPDALREAFGKRELHRSLRTSDLREAKALLALERVKLNAALEKLAREKKVHTISAQPLTDAEAWKLVADWFVRAEASTEALGPEAVTEERLQDFAFMTDAEDTNILSHAHREAEKLLVDNGYTVAPGSPAMVRLERLLHEAMIENEKRLLSRSSVNLPLVPNPRFSGLTAISVNPGAKPTTVADLLKLFRAAPEKSSRSPKTLLKQAAQDRVLLELLGPNTLISEIDRSKARNVQSRISSLPTNWTKRFPGVPLLELPPADTDKLSPTTANSYLSAFSGLMKFALDEHLIDRNPASGLRIVQDAFTSKRPGSPFSKPELVRIFDAPLYRGCVDDERNFQKPGPNRPKRGRFWVPLISLYSGMRLNEVCQLTADDIALIDGIDVIHVRISEKDADPEDRKRVKSAAGIRFVPIHPELKKMGLLYYVVSRRRDGHTSRLFPELPQGSTGYVSDPFSKWYSYFLKGLGIGGGGKSFHSFRHSYRDALEEADIPRTRVRALGGWSRGRGTEDEYGAGLSARSLAQAIEAVRYEGLDLSHLYS